MSTRSLIFGTVQTADEHVRIAHVQPLDDLLPDGARSSRGQRERYGMIQAVDDVAEAKVIGAEIVAPLADAVRFVDHEQRDAGFAQRFDNVLFA